MQNGNILHCRVLSYTAYALADLHELSRWLHEPSWMGLYGSMTPKPSYLMGVGSSSQEPKYIVTRILLDSISYS